MDYGRVLADAWRLLWRFKALWIFGFITALCNGSGFRGNFNYNFNGSPGGQLPPELDPLFRFLARPGVIISLILIV